MSEFSLHIDASQGTMTCDYDHDCFGQGLKFQHSCESGHGHGQWSWSVVMVKKSRSPVSRVKNHAV